MLIYDIVFVISVLLCTVRCDLDLPEGAKCITDGFNGTCVPMFRCGSASLTYVYNRQGYSHKNIAKFPDVCSQTDIKDEPIVCCTDCRILKTDQYRNAVIAPNGVLTIIAEGPKARYKCYDYFKTLPYKCRGYAVVKYVKKYIKDRMCHEPALYAFNAVGGRDAERWEFPHMALLGYGDTQKDAQWLCGGTIISERFILTAGHCVYSTTVGNVSFAALGLLKRSDPPENWKVYKIKRAITHPEYKPPSKYHDIALLETETEITFGQDVLPACVFSHLEDYPAASASGWGNLGGKEGVADVLQVVDLGEIDELTCLLEYPPHRLLKNGYNITTQMCYGSREAVADTCQGDSGGPLQTEEKKCLYTVEGVTSIGKECGKLGSPGLYTRVKFYVPWIESIVWPDE